MVTKSAFLWLHQPGQDAPGLIIKLGQISSVEPAPDSDGALVHLIGRDLPVRTHESPDDILLAIYREENIAP